MLVTADYSPAAKWNPDYDGLFTVRITSPNIKKTNELSFFITLSRFGQVKQLGIGINIHGPRPVGPGPRNGPWIPSNNFIQIQIIIMYWFVMRNKLMLKRLL